MKKLSKTLKKYSLKNVEQFNFNQFNDVGSARAVIEISPLQVLKEGTQILVVGGRYYI